VGFNNFNAGGPTSKLDVLGDVNTSTQYNIGGNRVLSLGGQVYNTFAGMNTGSNTSGLGNSFFGYGAGTGATSGSNNSFFGYFVGGIVGQGNSFFGSNVASSNQGDQNSFFGRQAGSGNTFGNNNVSVGMSAGAGNTVGGKNTFIGAFANAGSNNLTNATAIGADAQVTQSDSLVLGNGVKVGIGTTAPGRLLHVRGAGSDGFGQTDLRITGTGPVGSGITLESTGTAGRTYSLLSTADNTVGGGFPGGRLAFFDVTANAYRMVLDSSGNLGIGTVGPNAKLHVSGGDVAITNLGSGVILKAVDGPKCFRITVTNLGGLIQSEVTCP
jgi:hypothetical protein